MKSKSPIHLVPAGGAPSRKPLRILLADDDRDNASMLAAVMRDEGHEAVVALRGDEACEMCRLFRPDVVIADVNMPGMSGYALARELRERHGNLAPLLIALGEAVGFDHYLVKPVELRQLLSRITAFQDTGANKGSWSA